MKEEENMYKAGDRVMTNDMEYGVVLAVSFVENGKEWYAIKLDSGRRSVQDSSRLLSEAEGMRIWGKR